jgi:hypothetical protein
LKHDEREDDWTSEEFQVGSPKTLSYEGRISESHAWLTAAIDADQQGGQEERGEKVCPHNVPATLWKSRCFARRQRGDTPHCQIAGGRFSKPPHPILTLINRMVLSDIVRTSEWGGLAARTSHLAVTCLSKAELAPQMR